MSKKSKRTRAIEKQMIKNFDRTLERIEKKKERIIPDDVGAIEKIGNNGQRLNVWQHKEYK